MDDVTRLRNEYEKRKQRLAGSDIYSALNLANLFIIQSRQRAVQRALRTHNLLDLSGLRILEMGCGSGGVLTEYLGFGALPHNLYGVDLISDRLQQARARLPGSNFANADGVCLPFPAGSFDLALQYTAISSVLDPILRSAICADLLRIVRPGGLILSYDFWLNPTNPQTRGLMPDEIRQIFPGCNIRFYKINLAPPIARKLVPISWGLAHFLESLSLLNSHYLAAIHSPASTH